MIISNNIHRKLYEQNKDAQNIWGATQPEIDDLNAEMIRIFNNTRVNLSDIEGIIQWEQALNIFPDLARDTIEERRDRVLEALRTSPPFTENWLAYQLYRRFPDGGVFFSLARLVLRIYMDIEDVSLTEMPQVRRNLRELLAWFRTWIPSNLLLYPLPTIRISFPPLNQYIAGYFWRVPVRRFHGDATTPFASNVSFT